jgi:hypothetical protein
MHDIYSPNISFILIRLQLYLHRYPHTLNMSSKNPIAPDAPPSPNAKRIVARRARAVQQDKPTSVRRIARYMLFAGIAEKNGRVEGVHLIVSKNNIILNQFFLPPAPRSVREPWQALLQPKPDTCIGYLMRNHAVLAKCEAAFTADEESILSTYRLPGICTSPFSPRSGQRRVERRAWLMHRTRRRATVLL